MYYQTLLLYIHRNTFRVYVGCSREALYYVAVLVAHFFKDNQLVGHLGVWGHY